MLSTLPSLRCGWNIETSVNHNLHASSLTIPTPGFNKVTVEGPSLVQIRITFFSIISTYWEATYHLQGSLSVPYVEVTIADTRSIHNKIDQAIAI